MSEPKNRRERRALKKLKRKMKRPIRVIFLPESEDLSVDRRSTPPRGGSTIHQQNAN